MNQGQAIRIAAAVILFGTTVPAAAQAPLLDAPDISRIAELQETTTVRLRVPSLAGATGYRFRAATDREFQKIVIDTVQRRPEVRIVNLRDDEYYFGVRGVDANGLPGHEALGRFKLLRPPAPALTDPTAPAAPESPAPTPSSPATQ